MGWGLVNGEGLVGSKVGVRVMWDVNQNYKVFFSSGSQCWYFSHEPSALFYHSVLVDLSVTMMMH